VQARDGPATVNSLRVVSQELTRRTLTYRGAEPEGGTTTMAHATSTTLPATGTTAAAKTALNVTITGVAVLLAIITLYAVLDQGMFLSPAMGKIASSANYLHEFAHDARHLLGAPCH
jgi:hypothetical protein